MSSTKKPSPSPRDRAELKVALESVTLAASALTFAVRALHPIAVRTGDAQITAMLTQAQQALGRFGHIGEDAEYMLREEFPVPGEVE